MSSPAAYDAVASYLREVWNITPLVFENEMASAPTDDHWIFVEMVGGLYAQQSMGAETLDANLWREEGTLWLHVMMPSFRGTQTGRGYAWQLVQLLTRQPIPPIVFRDAMVGAGEPAVKIDGNFAAMTATIEWHRDE
ncbi:hypothetical protein [Xanthobacter flavus]|uniref:hypothetical protein n=1 Tax=Xanthobacter flavus TaxID=281 RepID=UPI00372974B4